MFNRAALAILLCGFALRVAFIHQLRDKPEFENLILDARVYDEQAQGIAAGRGPGVDVFYQDPLYPYLLAAVYRVAGRDLHLVRLLQAAAGCAAGWLLFRLAASWWGAATGLLALAFWAFYEPLIFYEGQVLKECLGPAGVVTLLFLLDLAIGGTRGEFGIAGTTNGQLPTSNKIPTSNEPTTGSGLVVEGWGFVGRWTLDVCRSALWAASGLVLGLLVLVRANLLPLALLVPFVAWSARGARPRGWVLRSTAAFLAGTALAIAPVTWRNWSVGGDLALTTAQAGQNFYTGNHPGNDTGRYVPPPFVRANPLYEQVDFRAEAVRRTGRPDLKPSDVSGYWAAETWRTIRAAPGRFLRNTFRRLALFGNAFEFPDNVNLYLTRAETAPILGLAAAKFAWIAPLALLGMIAAAAEWRRWLSAGLVLAVTAGTVSAFFLFARYRLPAVPVLILFAARAVTWAVEHWREGRLRRLPAAAGVVALAAVAVNWPVEALTTVRTESPVARFNRGMERLESGRWAEAREDFEAAVRIDPKFPAAAEAWQGIGVAILKDEGMAEMSSTFQVPGSKLHDTVSKRREWLERAVEAFGAALRLKPAYPEAHHRLGNALHLLGRRDEARAAYARAIEAAPDRRDPYVDLGELYFEDRDYGKARKCWEKALRLEPKDEALRRRILEAMAREADSTK